MVCVAFVPSERPRVVTCNVMITPGMDPEMRELLRYRYWKMPMSFWSEEAVQRVLDRAAQRLLAEGVAEPIGDATGLDFNAVNDETHEVPALVQCEQIPVH